MIIDRLYNRKVGLSMEDDTRDFIRDVIKEEAERIKGKMVGGTIYGYPIDMDSINSLIVGAYFVGHMETGQVIIKEMCNGK
jgi:hypothetical protein